PMLDRREEGDLRGLVEEVVGRVRHKRLITDVCERATARLRCEPSSGVQPLDEGGLKQLVATGRSLLVTNRIEQAPGNAFLLDGNRSIGLVHLGPDPARVLELPRGADRALGGHHLWISVRLIRVGAVEVGDDLPTVLAEQGGLRREQYVGDASA